MPAPITLPLNFDASSLSPTVLRAVNDAQSRIREIKLRIDSRPLGTISRDLTQFDRSLEASNARVLAFGASVGIIGAVAGAFKAMISSTIEVEKRLTDINVVLGASEKNFAQFTNNLFDVAKKTGESFETVATAATEFSRQGLGIPEILKRTTDALILSRLSGLSAAEAVQDLTAAINTFKREAVDSTQIINKLANVDAAFAVSSADLAEAIKRTGSAAEDAKVSLDQLVAIVTAAQQTTARGGGVIGNAFKTIFARINSSNTLDSLEELNIKVRDIQGNALPTINILKNLSDRFDSLSDAQKNSTARLVGGIYQLNILRGAIGDLSSGFSIYQRALDTSSQSVNEAIERNNALNDTFSSLINKTEVNLKQFFANFGKQTFEPIGKNIFNLFNSIFDSTNSGGGNGAKSFGQNMGQGLINGISDFLKGPAAVIVVSLVYKLFANAFSSAQGAFKSVISFNTESEKQKNIQEGINRVLASGNGAYEKRIEATKTIADQHRVILDILRQENALLAAQDSAYSAVASSLVGKVSFRGSANAEFKKPAFAGGYVPSFAEEAKAVRAGVGGADRSAHPVLLHGFKLGGGKRADVVANSSEYVVENYGGSDGSAVFNKEMIKKVGGIANLNKFGRAQKVAATGYVPNFAGLTKKQAEEIAKIHNENGGVSYHTKHGNLFGRDAYALSVFPERSLVIPRSIITPDEVQDFYGKNEDLFQNPLSAFGGWFDSESKNSYIDVSTAVRDRGAAIRAARRANQKAIYHLGGEGEINTGGTGESVVGLPSGEARLKNLFARRYLKGFKFAGGYVPNFANFVGSGMYGMFYDLDRKFKGMPIGKKEFHAFDQHVGNPAAKNTEQEYIASSILSGLNGKVHPIIHAPGVIGSLKRSIKREAIGKEVIGGLTRKGFNDHLLDIDHPQAAEIASLAKRLTSFAQDQYYTKGIDVSDLVDNLQNVKLNDALVSGLIEHGPKLYKGKARDAADFLADKGGRISAIDPGLFDLVPGKSPARSFLKKHFPGANFAAGYTPNFVDPLKAAIEREHAAGLPYSEIYVDKVKTPGYSGLVVANKRDEPTHSALVERVTKHPHPSKAGVVPNFASVGDKRFREAVEQAVKEVEEARERQRAHQEFADITSPLSSSSESIVRGTFLNEQIASSNLSNFDRKRLQKVTPDVYKQLETRVQQQIDSRLFRYNLQQATVAEETPRGFFGDIFGGIGLNGRVSRAASPTNSRESLEVANRVQELQQRRGSRLQERGFQASFLFPAIAGQAQAFANIDPNTQKGRAFQGVSSAISGGISIASLAPNAAGGGIGLAVAALGSLKAVSDNLTKSFEQLTKGLADSVNKRQEEITNVSNVAQAFENLKDIISNKGSKSAVTSATNSLSASLNAVPTRLQGRLRAAVQSNSETGVFDVLNEQSRIGGNNKSLAQVGALLAGKNDSSRLFNDPLANILSLGGRRSSLLASQDSATPDGFVKSFNGFLFNLGNKISGGDIKDLKKDFENAFKGLPLNLNQKEIGRVNSARSTDGNIAGFESLLKSSGFDRNNIKDIVQQLVVSAGSRGNAETQLGPILDRFLKDAKGQAKITDSLQQSSFKKIEANELLGQLLSQAGINSGLSAQTASGRRDLALSGFRGFVEGNRGDISKRFQNQLDYQQGVLSVSNDRQKSLESVRGDILTSLPHQFPTLTSDTIKSQFTDKVGDIVSGKTSGISGIQDIISFVKTNSTKPGEEKELQSKLIEMVGKLESIRQTSDQQLQQLEQQKVLAEQALKQEERANVLGGDFRKLKDFDFTSINQGLASSKLPTFSPLARDQGNSFSNAFYPQFDIDGANRVNRDRSRTTAIGSLDLFQTGLLKSDASTDLVRKQVQEATKGQLLNTIDTVLKNRNLPPSFRQDLLKQRGDVDNIAAEQARRFVPVTAGGKNPLVNEIQKNLESARVSVKPDENLQIIADQSRTIAENTLNTSKTLDAILALTTGGEDTAPKNKASGFVPSLPQREQAAINRGVGGALPFDRPINRFVNGLGNVVVNSGEVIDQNFMGSGKGAVLTRNMQKALARGYVPNFADNDPEITDPAALDYIDSQLVNDDLALIAEAYKKGGPEAMKAAIKKLYAGPDKKIDDGKRLANKARGYIPNFANLFGDDVASSLRKNRVLFSDSISDEVDYLKSASQPKVKQLLGSVQGYLFNRTVARHGGTAVKLDDLESAISATTPAGRSKSSAFYFSPTAEGGRDFVKSSFKNFFAPQASSNLTKLTEARGNRFLPETERLSKALRAGGSTFKDYVGSSLPGYILKPIDGVQSQGIIHPGATIPSSYLTHEGARVAVNPSEYLIQQAYTLQSERSLSRYLLNGGLHESLNSGKLGSFLPESVKNLSFLPKGIRGALTNHGFRDYSNFFNATEYRTHVATDKLGNASAVRFATANKDSPLRSQFANLFETDKIRAIQKAATNAVADLPLAYRRGGQIFGPDVALRDPAEALAENLSLGYDKNVPFRRNLFDRIVRGNFKQKTGYASVLELNPTNTGGASGNLSHGLELDALISQAKGELPSHAIGARIQNLLSGGRLRSGGGFRVNPRASEAGFILNPFGGFSGSSAPAAASSLGGVGSGSVGFQSPLGQAGLPGNSPLSGLSSPSNFQRFLGAANLRGVATGTLSNLLSPGKIESSFSNVLGSLKPTIGGVLSSPIRAAFSPLTGILDAGKFVKNASAGNFLKAGGNLLSVAGKGAGLLSAAVSVNDLLKSGGQNTVERNETRAKAATDLALLATPGVVQGVHAASSSIGSGISRLIGLGGNAVGLGNTAYVKAANEQGFSADFLGDAVSAVTGLFTANSELSKAKSHEAEIDKAYRKKIKEQQKAGINPVKIQLPAPNSSSEPDLAIGNSVTKAKAADPFAAVKGYTAGIDAQLVNYYRGGKGNINAIRGQLSSLANTAASAVDQGSETISGASEYYLDYANSRLNSINDAQDAAAARAKGFRSADDYRSFKSGGDLLAGNSHVSDQISPINLASSVTASDDKPLPKGAVGIDRDGNYIYAGGYIPNFADTLLGQYYSSLKPVTDTEDEQSKIARQLNDQYAASTGTSIYGAFNPSAFRSSLSGGGLGSNGGLGRGGYHRSKFGRSKARVSFDNIEAPGTALQNLLLSGVIGSEVGGQNLQDAIVREREALNARGYYASGLIQVGYSPRIGGVGVYNKIDEPHGLDQGIDRVIRRGGNPTQAGTVPNFSESLAELTKVVSQLQSSIGQNNGTTGAFDVNHNHNIQLSLAGEIRSNHAGVASAANEESQKMVESLQSRLRDMEVTSSKKNKDYILRPVTT